MRLRTGLGVAAIAALGAAPAAHAGTTNIAYDVYHPRGGPETVSASLTFEASPGEQNDLTVTYHDGHWLFHDAGAPVTPTNCQSVDEHTADCAAGAGPIHDDPTYFGLQAVTIDAGDGDDKVTAGPLSREVRTDVLGGAGNDTLTATSAGELTAPSLNGDGDDDTLLGSATQDSLAGGSGADTISGGDGDDYLRSGPGADALSGGDGDDTLYDSGVEREGDSFAGDAGNDTVDFSARKAPISVFLANQVSTGGDTLSDVEGLIGGSGADLLHAGPGDDTLDTSDLAKAPAADRHELVGCGTGTDLVTERDSTDRVPADCERATVRGDLDIAFPTLVVHPLTLTAHRLAGLAVECPAEAAPKGCRGSVTVQVRRGKRIITIGRAAVAANPGESAVAPIAISRDAPANLRESGVHKLIVKVRLDVHQPDGTAHLRDALTALVRN